MFSTVLGAGLGFFHFGLGKPFRQELEKSKYFGKYLQKGFQDFSEYVDFTPKKNCGASRRVKPSFLHRKYVDFPGKH